MTSMLRHAGSSQWGCIAKEVSASHDGPTGTAQVQIITAINTHTSDRHKSFYVDIVRACLHYLSKQESITLRVLG